MELAKSLIDELGRYIGIEGLVLDEKGSCTLVFDEHIVVTFVASDAVLSAICYIAEREDAPFFRQLLEANFAWQETGGATFAVEPNSARVVLSLKWPLAGFGFQTWVGELEKFVNASEAWQKIAAGDQTASVPTEDAAASAAGAAPAKKPAAKSAPPSRPPAGGDTLPRPGTRYV